MISVPGHNPRFLPIGVIVLLLVTSQSRIGWAQEPGKQVFDTTCFACHTIGGGRLVGPDLLGVNERRSQTWLEGFVKSSQSMINNGDADAVALFAEFNQLPMPDALISDEQISQVLDYIETQSSAAVAETSAESLVAKNQSEAQRNLPQKKTYKPDKIYSRGFSVSKRAGRHVTPVMKSGMMR